MAGGVGTGSSYGCVLELLEAMLVFVQGSTGLVEKRLRAAKEGVFVSVDKVGLRWDVSCVVCRVLAAGHLGW